MDFIDTLLFKGGNIAFLYVTLIWLSETYAC